MKNISELIKNGYEYILGNPILSGVAGNFTWWIIFVIFGFLILKFWKAIEKFIKGKYSQVIKYLRGDKNLDAVSKNETINKPDELKLYYGKIEATSKYKVLLDKFRYNWEKETYNSRGDAKYGHELIEKLTNDLREFRDNLNPDQNTNVKESISRILNKIREIIRDKHPSLTNYSITAPFWEGGLEIIRMMEQNDEKFK